MITIWENAAVVYYKVLPRELLLGFLTLEGGTGKLFRSFSNELPTYIIPIGHKILMCFLLPSVMKFSCYRLLPSLWRLQSEARKLKKEGARYTVVGLRHQSTEKSYEVSHRHPFIDNSILRTHHKFVHRRL